jgi:MSHA biogenesis protein MshE
VVNETEVLAAIDRIYRRTEDISDLARELEQDLGDVSVDFGALAAANANLEEAPVVKLLQSVFDDAAQVRASDIHIEPQEGGCKSASASTACCICRPRPISRSPRRWRCA